MPGVALVWTARRPLCLRGTHAVFPHDSQQRSCGTVGQAPAGA